jgi:rhomboid family GlyGly-CTERM serine protease
VNKGLLPIVNDVAERRLRRWWIVLALGLACLALAFGGDDARLWGRYERIALDHSQYWRLITAHVVHLGWGHLWPNLAALLLIGALFEHLFEDLDWLAIGAGSVAGIDFGLYVLEPNIQWYVGLSGVLHGFIAGGALTAMLRGQAIGAWLAIGLSCKLVWEQIFGPVPFTAAATGGPVVVAAHLYGAAGGFLSAAAVHFVRLRKSRL